MAGFAICFGMGADQMIISKLVIKIFRIEPDDLGLAPLVIGVTDRTFL